MRCEACHKRSVKPVVALDIDGTLAEYHMTFANMARLYWDLPQPVGAWDGDGEFEDWLGLTKEQYREAKLAYRQGGNKRWLPAYPGVRELVESLRAAGAEIWVCTTRPWQRLDNIDPDTREWCRRNGVAYDGMLYGESKYEQLVEAVHPERVMGVVDDLADYLRQAEYVGLPAFQVARMHNRAESARYTAWRYSLELIKSRLLNNIHEFNTKETA